MLGFLLGAGAGLALRSVPAAVVLAYVPVFVRTAFQMGKNFSHAEPRKMEVPSGVAQRANWCHTNQLELLPVYCGGVAAAVATGVDPKLMASRATTYLLGRVVYIMVYLIGEEKLPTQGFLRSAVWVFGCARPAVMLWVDAAKAIDL